MKRAAITAFVLGVLAAAAAFADNDQYDFDLIHRPPRITDAEVDAGVKVATKVCDPSGRLGYGSKPFLRCMRRQGYRLVRVERQESAPSAPYFSANVKLAPSHFIDCDTGMDCQKMGFADVCSPPGGTVHYFDADQGLPGARTGATAICSNM